MPDKQIQAQDQKEFVQWLQDNQLYNHMDSAHVMQRMHDVWRTMKDNQFLVTPQISELLDS